MRIVRVARVVRIVRVVRIAPIVRIAPTVAGRPPTASGPTNSAVTVKGEAGYFTTTTPGAQEYFLYVIQLERQVKEWSFVGGYAGEVVSARAGSPLNFTPDRGFAKSFVGRAALTIDVNRSLVLETVVRKAGSFARFEYSQTLGQHWRVTPGVAWIRGASTDFLGQYHRNSYVSLAIRYSF